MLRLRRTRINSPIKPLFDDNSVNSDYEKALYQSSGICWALTSHLFQNFSLREDFSIFYLSFDIPIADFAENFDGYILGCLWKLLGDFLWRATVGHIGVYFYC